jgi:hypothetical protein
MRPVLSRTNEKREKIISHIWHFYHHIVCSVDVLFKKDTVYMVSFIPFHVTNSLQGRETRILSDNFQEF